MLNMVCHTTFDDPFRTNSVRLGGQFLIDHFAGVMGGGTTAHFCRPRYSRTSHPTRRSPELALLGARNRTV